MQIFAAASENKDPVLAFDELEVSLCLSDRGQPQLLFLVVATGADIPGVYAEAKRRYQATSVHGSTSCMGLMTESALFLESGQALGALAIWDLEGAYGSASKNIGADASLSAAEATRAALKRANRSGQVPDLVWMSAAPGHEEASLVGIKEVLGDSVLIVGGSSADNDLRGDWAQFSQEELCAEGIVVSVLFSGSKVSSVFQSGYAPRGPSGRATKSVGRRLFEIDGRPAAEVYYGWLGQELPEIPAHETGRSILSESTLVPLGVIQHELVDVPLHLLLHPAVVHHDGSISLFCDVKQGDQLYLMEGTSRRLLERAGKIASQAKADVEARRLEACGALVVYCGGCMLSVRSEMEQVREGIAAALPGIPFLGLFSYGEQGATISGSTQHANLMISCTILTNSMPFVP